ncbi:MAG: DUF4340 domain-containing protein [Cytophagales bacterium]|nr:DUF4340 domain-containing protein [Cytophagales bacterium]
MFKKFSILHLAVILVILLGVYFALEFWDKKERSSSYRDELVSIDTMNISKMIVTTKSYPGKDIVLIKNNAGWYIRLKEGKNVPADNGEVKRAIDVLIQVKTRRLAANDPSKFNELRVDTSGTRVQVFEGDKKTLDLIIGKFSFQNKRDFYTYVRLADENEVYTTDAFLGPSFEKDFSRWRDQTIVRSAPDSITAITWAYPADSSFTLAKTLMKKGVTKSSRVLGRDLGGLWSVNGALADSTKVKNFLNSLRNIYSDKFADDVSKTNLSNKVFTMVIELSGSEKIEIGVYQHPTYKWIINSSTNPESYFASDDQIVVKKLFISKGRFLLENESNKKIR